MQKNFFYSLAICAILATFATTQTCFAQPGRGGGGFGGGGFAGGMMGQASGLGLLGDTKVQEELELVPDQVAALDELRRELQTEMREYFMSMRDRGRDGDREQMMQEIREDMEEINKEFDNRANKELLPHQRDRLKQLVFQSQARVGGGISAGRIPAALAEELGITDAQKEAMEEKARAVQEDLRKKIEKLTRQAEDEVLSVLDPGQRAKIKELFGSDFEFSRPQFGGMMGGRDREQGERGGQQQRGGDRRGQRGGDRRGDRGGDNDRDF